MECANVVVLLASLSCFQMSFSVSALNKVRFIKVNVYTLCEKKRDGWIVI